ncbi:DNA-directed DNA polymerase [Tanacetum coccineum]
MALKRTTRSTPATTTTPTTSVTDGQLKRLINQGIVDALVARDANRSRNDEDIHDSGTGVRRQAPPTRECTYPDFMKCKPLYFKGTEGVVELAQWFERMETMFRISNCSMENQIMFSTCTLHGSALMWWNSHVKTVRHNVAYAMTWTNLKKKMTDKHCPRGEVKKLEGEMLNLEVKGTDVVSYNQRFQELALMCARMFPEQSNKIEKYVGGLPDMIHGSVMASKPKTMHDAIEFATELMDKKIHTFAERQSENKRKVWSTANANTANNQRGTGAGQKPTCYECGAHGHFKRECPKLKNNNRGNQGGNGNAPAKVYAVGRAGINPDSNIVTDPEKLISQRNRSEPSLLFDLEEDDMAGQAPPQARGNFLTKNTQEALTIIENKSKVQTSRNKPQVASASGSSAQDAHINSLTKQVEALLALHRPVDSTQNGVNSVQNGCETCGGPHPYFECQATEPETITDPVLNKSTTSVPPPVVQPSPTFTKLPPALVSSPVIPEPNPHQPSISYPSRLNKEKFQGKADIQIHSFLQMFKKIHFNISFAEALAHMPKFAKMVKDLLKNKEKLLELANTPLNENFSVTLSLPNLSTTRMTLELATRTVAYPAGIAEDVFVQVGKFTFPSYYVVFDNEVEPRVPLSYRETFSDGSPTPSPDLVVESLLLSFTPFGDSDFLLEETDAFLSLDDSIPPGIDNGIYDSEGDILFLEELLNEDPTPNLPPIPHPVCLINETEKIKSSIDDPPDLELKDLPPHLEYAFLEGTSKLPVIIAKDLKREEKEQLLKVLKSHKRAIAWKISDIRGIDPNFCTHKILMEDDFKPAVQHQRRVNPKIHEVIKAEVIKLLDAGLIYPISDSPWVSPIHVVPKKGGMTVITNENNELIPTRLVTGWRVCIDYRKLNDATRKDHFPLPFMDQMLERLAGNEFYCFLDGFSGYFQIPIDPQDQDKTTFTCPYGTFAYRRIITRTLRLNQVPDDVVKLILFLFSLKGAAESWLENEPPSSIASWDDLLSKFLNRFFPHSKTRELRKEITNFQQVFDSLNIASGGNLMTINTQEALTIIKNKARVQTCINTPQVSSSGGTSTQIYAITILTKQVEALEYHFASMPENYDHNQKTSNQLMQNQMGQMEEIFQERDPRAGLHVITSMDGLTLDGSFIPHSLVYHEKEQEPETITEVVEIPSSQSTPLVPPPETPPLSVPKPKEDPKPNPYQPPIPYPCRLQEENFQALENPTGRADHFIYRIDISLSLSFTPSEEIDLLLEETDAFLSLDDLIPSGIDNGIYDSEGDILFLEELLNDEIPRDLPPKELKDDEPSTTKSLIEKALDIDKEIYDSEGDILFLEKLLKDEPSKANKSDIYTLIGEPPNTFLTKDEEIELNPLKDSDDSVLIPRVSVTPLDSLDSFFDSYDTSYTNPSELDSEYT